MKRLPKNFGKIKGKEVFGLKMNIHIKGCVGRRIKIEPFKSDILGQEDIIQKGKVIAVGPDSRCEVGDIVVFNNDGVDKIRLNDVDYYYVLDTDQFVYEII